jgi:hypothetical protein
MFLREAQLFQVKQWPPLLTMHRPFIVSPTLVYLNAPQWASDDVHPPNTMF